MLQAHEFSILVVEDEKNSMQILTGILAPEYEVYSTMYGESAIKIASEMMPDLILLDILLPDITGYDVISRLKKSSITRDIPVIFITGLNNIEDELKGLRLGAVDYITKPFHPTRVMARVKTQLEVTKKIRQAEMTGLIDSLTQIPNRRSFDCELEIEWKKAMRERCPLSLLMIDIDGFKLYNDIHGHQQGDVALKKIAQVLKSKMRRATDGVYRWGGEEFAVILPNTDQNGALKFAEDMRLAVEAAVIAGEYIDRDTSVTISIGVATVIPEVNSSSDQLIKHADNALYNAKNMGRNIACS